MAAYKYTKKHPEKKICEKILTPFFPGIAHSHVIKLRVPSVFLTGRATNPFEKCRLLKLTKK